MTSSEREIRSSASALMSRKLTQLANPNSASGTRSDAAARPRKRRTVTARACASCGSPLWTGKLPFSGMNGRPPCGLRRADQFRLARRG